MKQFALAMMVLLAVGSSSQAGQPVPHGFDVYPEGISFNAIVDGATILVIVPGRLQDINQVLANGFVAGASVTAPIYYATGGGVYIGTLDGKSVLHVEGVPIFRHATTPGVSLYTDATTSSEDGYQIIELSDSFYIREITAGSGTSLFTLTRTGGYTFKNKTAGSATLLALTADDDGNAVVVSKDATDDAYLDIYDGSGNADIRLLSDGNSYFNGSGNFGIGTSSPSDLQENQRASTNGPVFVGSKASVTAKYSENILTAADGIVSSKMVNGYSTDAGATTRYNTTQNAWLNNIDTRWSAGPKVHWYWYDAVGTGAYKMILNASGTLYMPEDEGGVRIDVDSVNNQIGANNTGASSSAVVKMGNKTFTVAFTGMHRFALGADLIEYVTSYQGTPKKALESLSGAAMLLGDDTKYHFATIAEATKFIGNFVNVTAWEDSTGKVLIKHATAMIPDGTETTNIRIPVPKDEARVWITKERPKTQIVTYQVTVPAIYGATEIVSPTRVEDATREEPVIAYTLTEYNEDGSIASIPVQATETYQERVRRSDVQFNKKTGEFFTFEQKPKFKEVILDGQEVDINGKRAGWRDYAYYVASEGDSFEKGELEGVWIKGPVLNGEYVQVSSQRGWFEKWDGSSRRVGLCRKNVSDDTKAGYITYVNQ